MSVMLGPEWHISKNGYDIFSETHNSTYEQLLKLALNTDIKEICTPFLSNEISKETTSKIVLQIQKIRNISAPKANEESQAAPRMLKLSLTDGETYVQALELSSLSSISRNNTPPGTKLLINNAKVLLGYILLTPDNCTLLGGRVPALIEKWELAKSIKNTPRRNSSEDGPPLWVNFGCKIQTNVEDNNFKSLGGKSKDVNKENSEFELQRQSAIAEASSGTIKKVFGGRVRQNIQTTTNINAKFEKKEYIRNKTKPFQKGRELEEKPEKPQERVSLFSYLENKLPVNEHNTYKTVEKVNDEWKNQDNKLSYRSPYLSERHNGNRNYCTNGYTPRNFDNTPKYSQNQKIVKTTNKITNDNEMKSGSTHQQNKNSENKHISQNQKNFNKLELLHPQRKTTNELNCESHVDKSYASRQPKSSGADVQNISQNYNVNTSNKTTFQPHHKRDFKDLEDTTQLMTKMSLNSQFASRSLRQHLNLGIPKVQAYSDPNTSHQNWHSGDGCLAKYWEDGKFYDAEVLTVTDKTIVVKFLGYGNIEEVLNSDCLPVALRNARQKPISQRNDQHNRGSMEFRRSSRNFN